MWPFKKSKPEEKKSKRHVLLYKCTYVLNAEVKDNEVKFNLDNKFEIVVQADDLIDAQVKIAGKIPMTPHIYIHRIEKLLEVDI